MAELNDFNWTYLTIIYIHFKFIFHNINSIHNLVKAYVKSKNSSTKNELVFYYFGRTGEYNTDVYDNKNTFDEYTKFKNKLISVIEKHISHIDWNVIMNIKSFIINDQIDIDANNLIREFVKTNIHYVNWKNIDTIIPKQIYQPGYDSRMPATMNMFNVDTFIVSLMLDEIDRIGFI